MLVLVPALELELELELEEQDDGRTLGALAATEVVAETVLPTPSCARPLNPFQRSAARRVSEAALACSGTAFASAHQDTSAAPCTLMQRRR